MKKLLLILALGLGACGQGNVSAYQVKQCTDLCDSHMGISRIEVFTLSYLIQEANTVCQCHDGVNKTIPWEE